MAEFKPSTSKSENKKNQDEIMKKDFIELLETVKKETLKKNAVEEVLKTMTREDLLLYGKRINGVYSGLHKDDIITKILEYWRSSKTKKQEEKLPCSASKVKEAENQFSKLSLQMNETKSGESSLPNQVINVSINTNTSTQKTKKTTKNTK